MAESLPPNAKRFRGFPTTDISQAIQRKPVSNTPPPPLKAEERAVILRRYYHLKHDPNRIAAAMKVHVNVIHEVLRFAWHREMGSGAAA